MAALALHIQGPALLVPKHLLQLLSALCPRFCAEGKLLGRQHTVESASGSCELAVHHLSSRSLVWDKGQVVVVPTSDSVREGPVR